MLELRAVAKGHVQGVGFRATAAMLARKGNLLGYAKNLSDGSVEILAQGEKSALEGLVLELKSEFPKIEKFETSYREVSKAFTSFTIE
jgi:acylphosphatase